MRKALVVGINSYANVSPLYGCVNDALAVNTMLSRHADGSVNFGVKCLTATGSSGSVGRDELRKAIASLFDGDGEVSLFYFAGHGHIEATGGYLCSSDVKTGNDGVPLAEIMTMANQSKIQNRLIILDSCYSGVTGGSPLQQKVAEISDGVTILTASTAEQYATEENRAGVFTSLLIDALGGAAANLVGDVTPGGVYAHVDQSLGPWAQRPVFKTNVKRFVSLRKVQPPLEPAELRRISEFFPAPGFQFQLDPTYEPERYETWATDPKSVPAPDPDHNAIFKILQNYNRVGLVMPEGAPHMWHAAMESKTIRLTALGEYYRLLAVKNLI
ncbi:caspase family protein [Xylella taiwanensis]|uniref:Caspase family protein n=1 Tax=Xylella taiwanensis TaxID=1444770 RepID=Z9JK53_9GAMM|nr:caspase family protein [Xylella taiwanensis]AXI82798.1 peptidase C14 [Xylella taiwanensis]EWS78514.1 peptidase C14 [Xylella taiwanensis]MCD8455809.1 caspase family protein [Xylella taiwanensis]MCD8458214.1 caspase family protein [Xylella taiwanensis]MCD8460350.1 caspase family protein [Xylella taiwanensis]